MRHPARFLLGVAIATLAAWPTAAGDIRVMAWNLQDMDLFDGSGLHRVAWQAEAAADIAETIRRVNPDILFIAEAPSSIELGFFVDAHGLAYHVVHLRQQSGRRDFADGMALLCRERPIDASLETPPVPGSGRSPGSAYLDWSYRGLLVVRFPEYTVVGTHLKSPWDGKRRSYEIRDAQARALVDYCSAIPGPLVLLGDFNDSPGRDDKESTFGVRDTLDILDDTFVWSSGADATQEKGFNLDHIFVRDAMAGSRYVERTDWILSDHRPVWADVTY